MTRRAAWGLALTALAVSGSSVWFTVPTSKAAETPRSAFSCGKCPDGYATVGIGTDAKMCPEGDGAVLQCAMIGIPRLAVCGSCPDGYVQVGTSNVPSRCGSADGGRMSQCQLENLGAGLPDSATAKTCPPDCGSTATPGQGGGPVPQFRDLREKKDKPTP
jgi:hypothetical protein